MGTSHGKKWNNGNLSLSPAHKRVSFGRQVIINARQERVFRLACLAAGETWPDGGSATGPGCHTRCYPVLLDVKRHRVDAFLVSGSIAAGKVQVDAHDRGDHSSLVSLVLTCTALNEQGNQLLGQGFGQNMDHALQQFAEKLKQRSEQPDDVETSAPPLASKQRGGIQRERAGTSHQIVIQGDPDRCFALACPVAELDWIDGWCFDLIYSDSGRNEDNNIFMEPMTGLGILRCPGANTYWYTTLFDTKTRRFHAVLFTPELTIAKFELALDDLGDGQTRMRWNLTYSGLSDKGNMILAEPGFDQRISGMLDLLARSARNYIETGNKYRLPSRRRARVLISVIGAAVGRHVRRRRSSEQGSSRSSRVNITSAL